MATKKSKTPTPHSQLPPGLKVAIVHDWLIGGGAELVVEQLHHLYPHAPIYTSYATREWRKRLNGQVRTGLLQHWPFSRLRKFLPLLRIWWFSRLKLDGYDLVISSSGAEAKGINVPSGTVHINYCHAPTHYYWSRYEAYMKHPGIGLLDPLARIGLRLLVSPLRTWDYQAAQKPDYMIANSTHTKDEIKKYYDRDADVVFPPVNVERFTPETYDDRYGYIIAGRQTPYKRFDLAIQACNQTKTPLLVIGKGPDHDRLTSLAGPSVRFMTNVSDQELLRHFHRGAGFIFPGIDDFGIVAVEALAAGMPVIAFRGGGAGDYIQEGKTGVFFDEPTVESLAAVLKQFDPTMYNARQISRTAQKFNISVFVTKMSKLVTKYQHKGPR